MVGAKLSASVTGVGSSVAAATLVGSGLYPHPYPVAGRTWLDSAGADRTIRAQPEPAGRFPRIRYAYHNMLWFKRLNAHILWCCLRADV